MCFKSQNKDYAMNKPLVLFLVGPTAGGKTDTAVELAQKINAEIISADSMQVYRKMDILSAKPSKEQLSMVPHHLIDILDPAEEYNAAIFREKALECIEQIVAKNKIPLIVGGTGLYVKELTKGIFSDNAKDEQLRKQLAKEAQHLGNAHLYERLKQVDPEAASKIHPNDLRRIIRAIEVYEISGSPISELQSCIEGLDARYEYRIFGIRRERKELYQRIEQRVDLMFEQGFLEEAEKLLALNLSHTAKQALGIKQVKDYKDNKLTLEEAKSLVKRDSRRYAKRQLTWFCAQKDIIWLEADDQSGSKELAEKIRSLLSL